MMHLACVQNNPSNTSSRPKGFETGFKQMPICSRHVPLLQLVQLCNTEDVQRTIKTTLRTAWQRDSSGLAGSGDTLMMQLANDFSPISPDRHRQQIPESLRQPAILSTLAKLRLTSAKKDSSSLNIRLYTATAAKELRHLETSSLQTLLSAPALKPS